MRTTLTFLLSLAIVTTLLFASCSKDDVATPPANPAFRGDFVSAAHQTRGIATIDQEKTTLTLTNFKTDSGPDLNIYLTSSLSAISSDFIDLGNIKGVTCQIIWTIHSINLSLSGVLILTLILVTPNLYNNSLYYFVTPKIFELC